MITRKCCAICITVALCTFAFGSFQVVAGPISMRTTVSLGEGTINLSYSSEESVLSVTYSTDGKECRLTLTSTQRMELLIEVAGAEITYSLRFLEEDETWPTADTLEDEQCTSKAIFKAPGWIVIIVQTAE